MFFFIDSFFGWIVRRENHVSCISLKANLSSKRKHLTAARWLCHFCSNPFVLQTNIAFIFCNNLLLFGTNNVYFCFVGLPFELSLRIIRCSFLVCIVLFASLIEYAKRKINRIETKAIFHFAKHSSVFKIIRPSLPYKCRRTVYS